MGEHTIISKSGLGLTTEEVIENFSDLHPCLAPIQARVASEHCLYCYDAPCITACPTGIDIPTFIHEISTQNIKSAARTILTENIMGGTCARACPTETLCEQACVRNKSGEKPVNIGQLQRFAVDHYMASDEPHPFKKAPDTGKKIAVIGAGPAGLSCAHRLAMLGHAVDVYDAEEKAGGLNEYGLAAYKMADDFAAREVAFILEIGGITIHSGKRLGRDVKLDELNQNYDAVFIGIGLTSTRTLGIKGENLDGVRDAIDFIKDIRQASDLSTVKTGENIIIVGGGNTAIDAAIQAKRLGASSVSLVYRRGPTQMTATQWEQDLAAHNHVNIYHWASPDEIIGEGQIEAIRFDRTAIKDGQMVNTGKKMILPCDQLFKAIGQTMNSSALAELEVKNNKIMVDEKLSTSKTGIFAGGDCTPHGEDLTVEAVEQGKQAAISIDNYIKGEA